MFPAVPVSRGDVRASHTQILTQSIWYFRELVSPRLIFRSHYRSNPPSTVEGAGVADGAPSSRFSNTKSAVKLPDILPLRDYLHLNMFFRSETLSWAGGRADGWARILLSPFNSTDCYNSGYSRLLHAVTTITAPVLTLPTYLLPLPCLLSLTREIREHRLLYNASELTAIAGASISPSHPLWMFFE